jgi:uncharacterized protein
MLGMSWSHLVFVHWQLPPEALAPLVPSPLQLDCFHGSAWLSLVALHVNGPIPEPAMGTPMERLARYRQLNLRTYVVGDRGRGIFLLDTRVDRALPLGARLLGMPYHLDGALAIEGVGETVRVATRDFTIAGVLDEERPRAVISPLGIGSFLLNRFRSYGRLPGGKLYSVEIAHEPWHTRALELMTLTSSSEVGFPGAAAPASAHVADPLQVGITAIHLYEREGLELEAGR